MANAEQKQNIQKHIQAILAKSSRNSIAVASESKTALNDSTIIEEEHEYRETKDSRKPSFIPKLDIAKSSPRLKRKQFTKTLNMASRDLRESPMDSIQRVSSIKNEIFRKQRGTLQPNISPREHLYKQIFDTQQNERPIPFDIRRKMEKREQRGPFLSQPRSIKRPNNHKSGGLKNSKNDSSIEFDSQILLQSSRRDSQTKFIINEQSDNPERQEAARPKRAKPGKPVTNENYKEMKTTLQKQYYESQKKGKSQGKKSNEELSPQEKDASNIFESSRTNIFSERAEGKQVAIQLPCSAETERQKMNGGIAYQRHTSQEKKLSTGQHTSIEPSLDNPLTPPLPQKPDYFVQSGDLGFIESNPHKQQKWISQGGERRNLPKKRILKVKQPNAQAIEDQQK